ncbi:hypothetical protein AK812_SmicGene2110 [Symbiodinium microadriaticum]|uniref:Uncharacterized protein n=1 Tax=Symbiodinium microadriaticum TaxID=2951 RepID=A0A1Q9F2N3_SYMMI|nr:hypothetical protein AK812_SmicGene2110 [Symbiodinium microadriaticum]
MPALCECVSRNPADAISKMMDGQGTGKGLNVKGKSAKTGCLSGFVPVLQISDNEHKSQVCTSPREARVRLPAAAIKEAVHGPQARYGEKDVELSAAAQRLEAHQAPSAASVGMCSLPVLLLNMVVLFLVQPPFVLRVMRQQQQQHQQYVAQPDISRQGAWQTGRASEPAFMDMRITKTYETKALHLEPQTDHDIDALNPLSLLMAYEEEKARKGSGNIRFEPLPPDQVDMMKWCLGHIEEVLSTPSKTGLMLTVVASVDDRMDVAEVLKRESDAGFHPEIPRFGFGDPTSYTIVEQLVVAMGLLGAVRHGAECFNFYFPQVPFKAFLSCGCQAKSCKTAMKPDLDDEFLVIWPGFGADQPWQQPSDTEVFTGTLVNPSCGTFCLIACNGATAFLCGSPQESEVDYLRSRILTPREEAAGCLVSATCVEELDIDLAARAPESEAHLSEAKRKLRVVLRWMKLNKGKGLSNGEGQALKEDSAVEADQHRPDSMQPLTVADDKAEKKCGQIEKMDLNLASEGSYAKPLRPKSCRASFLVSQREVWAFSCGSRASSGPVWGPLMLDASCCIASLCPSGIGKAESSQTDSEIEKGGRLHDEDQISARQVRGPGSCQRCCGGCCWVMLIVALVEVVFACVAGFGLAIGVSVVLAPLAMLNAVFLCNLGPCRLSFAWLCLLGTLTGPFGFFGAIFLAKDVWTLAGDPNWLETPTFPGECTVGGCCRVTVSLPHRAENLEPLLVKNTPMATVRDELHRWVDPGKINWQEDCEWRGSLLLTGGSAEGAVPSEVRKLAVANCRSLSWKFVDDMAWQLSDVNCTDGSTGVLVEMHSQQRVGMDDGRHNFYRVAFCYAFLTDRFANLAVPFNGSSC